ncbi:hypothetical protein BaRGS_00023968, partial [Batillaria attramentaria]
MCMCQIRFPVFRFFDCPRGVRQRCSASPVTFSLLINEVANCVNENGNHGIQLLPGFQELFSLLFVDDVSLMSATPVRLQNQISNLERASKNLGLQVSLEKTKVMVFRKGEHLSAKEKWYIGSTQIEVVNSYRYLGFTLSAKLSFTNALLDYAKKWKDKVAQLLQTMFKLGNINPSIFFKLCDAQ